MVVSSETWPEDSASAFAVQTCSSRKPLPTPPPFEYPILYCVAALGAASDAAALGAPALGAAALGAAVPAGVLQAAANTAAAAKTASNLARVVFCSVMRTPP